MAGQSRGRLELVHAFAGAAANYWLGIFPQVELELRRWQRRARLIPDPLLRHHAISTQEAERGNLEGAAAFAILAPRARRAEVIRAAVAFQLAYDYVDSLSEQPSENPVANGQQLHLALLAALDPTTEHTDYYRHSFSDRDHGYIRSLADTCRNALATLPSYATVARTALRATERMIVYQSLNHGTNDGSRDQRALARWATKETPCGTGLRWWETAAGAASSLNVFCLFAAAGEPHLRAGEVEAMEHAYFPWISSLHVLLDSLIDRAADIETGHHSLMDHYASTEEAAARMGAIAGHAMRATHSVPNGAQHALILAAMACFYLSAPGARTPSTRPIAHQVSEQIGILARPTMAVLRARRGASRALDGARALR